MRPGEDFDHSCGHDLLLNVDVSGEIGVDMIVNGDILNMTLSDGRVMTMRLDDRTESGVQTELYAIAGSLTASEIKIYSDVIPWFRLV